MRSTSPFPNPPPRYCRRACPSPKPRSSCATFPRPSRSRGARARRRRVGPGDGRGGSLGALLRPGRQAQRRARDRGGRGRRARAGGALLRGGPRRELSAPRTSPRRCCASPRARRRRGVREHRRPDDLAGGLRQPRLPRPAGDGGSHGGGKVEIDVTTLYRRRHRHHRRPRQTAPTCSARSTWPRPASSRRRSTACCRSPQAAVAHRLLKSSDVLGKIILDPTLV